VWLHDRLDSLRDELLVAGPGKGVVGLHYAVNPRRFFFFHVTCMHYLLIAIPTRSALDVVLPRQMSAALLQEPPILIARGEVSVTCQLSGCLWLHKVGYWSCLWV
jgi:hypothetical protein